MNYMGPTNWYQKEEEKRKNRMKANDISLLNRQLQQLLHEVQHNIDDWKIYQGIANRLEQQYRVSQCGLWKLSWANNFESEKVALAQGLLIAHILKNESLKDKRRLNEQVDILMRRLGNVDWGIYLEYGKLKGRI